MFNRKGFTLVELMIVIAVIAVMRLMLDVVYDETGQLGSSLTTSLTTDGVQQN